METLLLFAGLILGGLWYHEKVKESYMATMFGATIVAFHFVFPSIALAAGMTTIPTFPFWAFLAPFLGVGAFWLAEQLSEIIQREYAKRHPS